jgi:RNA-binding protein
MELTGADKRALRALGHHLDPLVFVGREGVSEPLVNAVREAHENAELLKVRILDTCSGERREIARELETRTGSELIQVLGRTVLLFRRHPEHPRISLPSFPLPEQG